MIGAEASLRIMGRRLDMMRLCFCRRYMALIAEPPLLCRWRVIDAVRAARIRHAIVVDDRSVMHNCLINVGIVSPSSANPYMHHSCVVEE